MKYSQIILIDDDPMTNVYNRFLVQKSNLASDIVVFENGSEAINYLTKTIHDSGKGMLILLDINMPKTNGWDVLEALSLQSRTREFRVIMVTSSIDPNDMERAKSYELVSDFISKPLTAEAL